MIYDRAGLIEGTCFVKFRYESSAMEAIHRNDASRAIGRPITITLVGALALVADQDTSMAEAEEWGLILDDDGDLVL
jgi:hypothetical protein